MAGKQEIADLQRGSYVWADRQGGKRQPLVIGSLIGRGANAPVFEVDGRHSDLCAKLFPPSALHRSDINKRPDEQNLWTKINRSPGENGLSARESGLSIAWPEGVVYNASGFCGYVMQRVQMSSVKSFADIIYGRAKKPLPSATSYVHAARSFANNIAWTHFAGHAFIDANPNNFLFNPKQNRTYLIDCDNFATFNLDGGHENFYSKDFFNSDGFVSPMQLAAQDSVNWQGYEHDRYILAIYIYRLLFNIHPFTELRARPMGDTASFAPRINQKLFHFRNGMPRANEIGLPNFPLPYYADTHDLFTRTFVHNDPVTAGDWVHHLDEKYLPGRRPVAGSETGENTVLSQKNTENNIVPRKKNSNPFFTFLFEKNGLLASLFVVVISIHIWIRADAGDPIRLVSAHLSDCGYHYYIDDICKQKPLGQAYLEAAAFLDGAQAHIVSIEREAPNSVLHQNYPRSAQPYGYSDKPHTAYFTLVDKGKERLTRDDYIFIGPIVENRMHGEGSLYLTKGYDDDAQLVKIYTGGFRNGTFNGAGRFFTSERMTTSETSPRLVYEGFVENGLFHGTGTLFFPKNYKTNRLGPSQDKRREFISYRGSFRRGVANGTGEYKFVDGERILTAVETPDFPLTWVNGCEVARRRQMICDLQNDICSPTLTGILACRLPVPTYNVPWYIVTP